MLSIYYDFEKCFRCCNFAKIKLGMKKGFFNVILPERKEDAVAILLYGYIGNEEKVDSASVVSEIRSLSSQYKNIDVRINSMGGEVYAGLAIFNALRESDAIINIYIDGVAASMAAVVALCGRPLHMSRYSRLMLHAVSGGVCGSSQHIRAYADQIDALTDTLAAIVAERASMTTEEVKARWFDGNDHWLTSNEALVLKLADSVYDMPDGAAPSEDATAESIYEFTNRLNAQPQINVNMVLLEELRKRTSFTNAATEEQALEAIAKLENDAAKVPALEARIEALEREKKQFTDKARTAYLDQAVADGRIQEAQKAHFLALMEHDEAGVKAVIDSMPKGAGRISSFIGESGQQNLSARAELEKMTWDEIDRAERLAELKNNYPELYQAKFNETFKK